VDIVMGPILYFRGLTAGRCHLAALIVVSSDSMPPELTVSAGDKALPERLATRLGLTVWRYPFSVRADGSESRCTYTIGSHTWPLFAPTSDPLRIAFTACNGSEDDDPAFGDPSRNERWRHLADEHARSPFHLLLQGGDQMYADRLWRDIPELAAWRRLSRQAQLQTPMPPETAEAVADFYFQRYCRLWSQTELAPLVASIPSVMMWDDHDIFDGWGSHPQALQRCPVYRGIWSAAREHFALFQLGARPEALPAGIGDPAGSHFGWAFAMGRMGVIAPDLRSARTPTQVMSDAGWRWLEQALHGLRDCHHVLFVSTVPVVHVPLRALERFLFWIPRQQLYQDDLRDQWQSYAHQAEWRRLVHRLLDFSEQTRTAVTLLSGEIHLGAFGCVERGSTRLYQLISSGIVHPAPPALVARLFHWLSLWPHALSDAIGMRMLPLPQIHSHYFAARNWLSIASAPDAALEVNWHVEGMPEALSVTIAGPSS
jgi:PhoD related phosphatase